MPARAAIESELLLRLLNATPEQYAAVERILMGEKRDACCVLREEDPASAPPVPRNVFRRAGSHWDVVFDGNKMFHLEDTLGARYLDYLFHHPGEAISAFNLEIAIRPERAAVRSQNSIQAALDPATIRNYLRELTRLRSERELADERGDRAGVDQLDAEIEAVETALADGGRSADTGERARGNVSKAIAVVRRRLAVGSPAEKELGQHLGQFLSVGYECGYHPPHGQVWEV